MKKLLWALLILALAAYTVVVWCWIQEGNRHFEQQRREREQIHMLQPNL